MNNFMLGGNGRIELVNRQIFPKSMSPNMYEFIKLGFKFYERNEGNRGEQEEPEYIVNVMYPHGWMIVEVIGFARSGYSYDLYDGVSSHRASITLAGGKFQDIDKKGQIDANLLTRYGILDGADVSERYPNPKLKGNPASLRYGDVVIWDRKEMQAIELFKLEMYSGKPDTANYYNLREAAAKRLSEMHPNYQNPVAYWKEV